MKRMPLISIIIPAFNSEKWLGECLESASGQTYPNIEIILIDDGSSDGTLSLASSFAEKRENIRVIHTENGGVCRARNTGIEEASGEYIVFLDSDDIMTKDAVERLYHHLISSDADIAVGWKSNMSSDGTVMGCPYKKTKGVFDGADALRLSLEDHPAMYAVWGKLYKRSIIGGTRFTEGRKVNEDSFFVFECLLKCPEVVICDEIVVYYRLSENSASRSSFSDKFFDIIYFAERKYECIKSDFPEFLLLAENVLVKANMSLLRNLLKADSRKYKTAEKKAIRNVLSRKKYYKSAIETDGKWFFIITHRLYFFYKKLYLLKNKLFLRRH